MANKPVYGLVLAGGQSRRMGRDKALLQRGGQSQLAFAMSVVTQCVDRVFVSTRVDQTNDAERAQFDQIVDRYDDMGPVAGILTALEDYPEVDWLVVACDLPNISVETMQLLLRNREGEQAFIAYRSSHDDLPEPLCAVYRSGCTDIVRQFVNDGIHCPRKILIRSDTLLLEQMDPKSLDNVNTPDDLRNSLLQANS